MEFRNLEAFNDLKHTTRAMLNDSELTITEALLRNPVSGQTLAREFVTQAILSNTTQALLNDTELNITQTLLKLPISEALAREVMNETQAQGVYQQQATLSGEFSYWFEIVLYNYLYNEMHTRQIALPDGSTVQQVDLPPHYAYYNPLLGVGRTKWTQPSGRELIQLLSKLF